MRRTKAKTRTFSIKLAPALSEKVVRLAKKRRVPVSVVVREALEAVEESQELSAADLMRDLIGKFEGPADLSTNPKHMKGFGK